MNSPDNQNRRRPSPKGGNEAKGSTRRGFLSTAVKSGLAGLFTPGGVAILSELSTPKGRTSSEAGRVETAAETFQKLGIHVERKDLYLEVKKDNTKERLAYAGAKILGLDLEWSAAIGLANVCYEAYRLDGRELLFSRSHGDYKIIVESHDVQTDIWMSENGPGYGFLPLEPDLYNIKVTRCYMHAPAQARALDDLFERTNTAGYHWCRALETLDDTLNAVYPHVSPSDREALASLTKKLNPWIGDGSDLSGHSIIALPKLKAQTEAGKIVQHYRKTVQEKYREQEYRVQEGDTLRAIAKEHYGDAELWRALRDYNNLPNDALHIQQILILPAKDSLAALRPSSDRDATKRPAYHPVKNLRLSRTGLEIIMSFEDCFLKAYQCPGGVWTIGYGNTKKAKEGMTLPNKEAARRLLMADILFAEREVKEHITVPLTQGQFDALVSGEFNTGWIHRGKHGLSKLSRLINARASLDDIQDAFFEWVNVKGVPSAGIVRRRVSEFLRFVGAADPIVSYEEFRRLRTEAGGLFAKTIFELALEHRREKGGERGLNT